MNLLSAVFFLHGIYESQHGNDIKILLLHKLNSVIGSKVGGVIGKVEIPIGVINVHVFFSCVFWSKVPLNGASLDP
jgi:hypothetical protein